MCNSATIALLLNNSLRHTTHTHATDDDDDGGENCYQRSVNFSYYFPFDLTLLWWLFPQIDISVIFLERCNSLPDVKISFCVNVKMFSIERMHHPKTKIS